MSALSKCHTDRGLREGLGTGVKSFELRKDDSVFIMKRTKRLRDGIKFTDNSIRFSSMNMDKNDFEL